MFDIFLPLFYRFEFTFKSRNKAALAIKRLKLNHDLFQNPKQR